MLHPEKQRKTAISVLSMLFVLITVLIFIRPEFAFAFALSSHWLTESCLIKLVDVTDEDTFSKVVDVVTMIENDVLESFDRRFVATSWQKQFWQIGILEFYDSRSLDTACENQPWPLQSIVNYHRLSIELTIWDSREFLLEIILRMLDSSGFWKYSLLLVFQLFSRRLYHCLCLCLCVCRCIYISVWI